MLLHSVCTINLALTGTLPHCQQAAYLKQIENIFNMAQKAVPVTEADKDKDYSPAFV